MSDPRFLRQYLNLLTESENVSAADVWHYVRQLNVYDDGEEPTALRDWIAKFPRWQLKDVPVDSLIIPPSDEDDAPPLRTPYVQAISISPDDVNVHNVDRLPIIVDPDGYILDGNHRAWAAKNLLHHDTIKAYVAL